ncbi:MAG: UMP kinase [Patescibacteria group bacterium]
MIKHETVVLSLGGSLVVPARIDSGYLKKFRRMVIGLVSRGYRFIIVTGGGDTARQYQRGARAAGVRLEADLDWIGIAATKINAELVRAVFGPAAHHTVVIDPTKRLKTSKKIIIGSGWRPGCSSDKDAVLLARTYGANRVINMSNIPYVYTADPRADRTARPLRQMSWDQLFAITGRRWRPGAHVPFDPEAAKLAQIHGIRVIVCAGSQLANISNIIRMRSYRGTTIA